MLFSSDDVGAGALAGRCVGKIDMPYTDMVGFHRIFPAT